MEATTAATPTPVQMSAMLRELETCHALFYSLFLLLDNNMMVSDYRSLAVMAADGKRKLDGLMDLVASA